MLLYSQECYYLLGIFMTELAKSKILARWAILANN
jgi:hypothetical protein